MSRPIVLGLMLAVAAPAVAAGPEPAGGRYAFVPVAAGALRLDTDTGDVSLCVGGTAAPTCTRVSENVRLTVGERAKLEAKIAEIESRVGAFEAQIATLELQAQQASGSPSADETAMRRVKILATRLVNHFVGAVGAVKNDLRGSQL